MSVNIIRSREPAMTDLATLQSQSRNVLHVPYILRPPHLIPVRAQTPQPPDPPFNPDTPPSPSPQEPDTIPDPTREPPSPPSQPIGDPPPGPNETPHVSGMLH
jgi:hypothetical protein